MTELNRLQLQQMIKETNADDQTNLIRELKHSHKLQADINNLLMLKSKYKTDLVKISEEAAIQCSFLFTYYTDIFNKIKKDEIDLKILNKFLNILRMIEDEEIEQHEGCVMVGTLLKEMYIDSALKKADKINDTEQNKNNQEIERKVEQVKISWSEYKKFSK
jgi:hypothetical protein